LTVILLALLAATRAWPAAPVLPNTPYNYANPPLPMHFTDQETAQRDTSPRENPVTDLGATLGRVLFYDRQLSREGDLACASCHIQSHGFSDPRPLSNGFQGRRTDRHSMALANLRWNGDGSMLWDHSQPSLEHQALLPIQNPREMALHIDDVISRMETLAYYPPLFEAAFGDSEISEDRIARALSQFVRAMVSFRSPFDRGLEQDFQNFTELERGGMAIFYRDGSCAACHVGNLQLFDQPDSNGLDIESEDVGYQVVTGAPEDSGKFRPPSLRNIAIRPPYMHDGRFSTLDEVIDHYSNGIQPSPGLSAVLSTDSGKAPRKMNFSDKNKKSLVAFLHTLTDRAFLDDEKFSDPFR